MAPRGAIFLALIAPRGAKWRQLLASIGEKNGIAIFQYEKVGKSPIGAISANWRHLAPFGAIFLAPRGATWRHFFNILKNRHLAPRGATD